MREWLDRERCNLSQFRHTSGEDGVIIISVGFSGTDGLKADAFLLQFGGAG
jgi:hypothetical protein